MPHMIRRAALSAALVLTSVLLALVVVAPSASAATSFTWRGLGDGHSWTDPKNWTPLAVPGDGDSVLIQSYNDNMCHAHVDAVPDGLDLADLTVDETAYLGNVNSPCLTSLDGGSITVEGNFAFHAGTIDTPITLSPTAQGVITPNVVVDTTHIGGPFTVQGALTLAGDSGARNLSLSGSPGLTVAAGGTLTSQGDNVVSANCCTDAAQLTDNGTMALTGGTLDMQSVELHQNAALTTDAAS